MKWKTISIFISSTFNDMHAERDYIRKILVPRLNEALYPYRVCVQATDLRWGISTAGTTEEEREAKVLHVCMNAIHNTRPYFVALIGDRYGWIPSPSRIHNAVAVLPPEQRAFVGERSGQPCSVTEMEILLGAIGAPALLDHSFFCFRSPDAYNGIPDAMRRTFADPEGSEAHRRLEALKEKIRAVCNSDNHRQRIVGYRPEWNDERGQFDHFEELGDRLFDLICSDIIADTEKDGAYESPEDSLMDDEDKALASFVGVNAMNFCGRKGLCDDLTDFILSRRSAEGALQGPNGRFLAGFSGCGKSYVFSALCARLEAMRASENLVILSHAAGITRESTSVRNMLLRWNRRLLRVLGDDAVPDPAHPEEQFRSLVLRVQGQGLFPVAVIDSFDSFRGDSDRWLKKFDFIPYSVPVVCTTLPGYTDAVVRANPRFETVDIDTFSREDALEVIRRRLQSNVKELNPSQIASLLGKTTPDGLPAYTSPLWLQMALSILLELGSEDFRDIHKQQFEEEDRKIEAYLQQTIERLPATPDALFAYFITLTTRYFSKPMTTKALTYIALTIDGIDEDALVALVGEHWDALEFTGLHYWMREFIRRDTHSGRWVFTHNILKNVVCNMNKEHLDEMTLHLMAYLGQRAVEDESLLKEYVRLLIAGRYYEAFYNFVTDNDNAYNVSYAMAALARNIDKADLLQFMDGLMKKYYTWDEAATLVSNTVLTLADEARNSPDEAERAFIIDLASTHARNFTEADIYEGDPYLLVDYFDALDVVFSLYEDFEMQDAYNRAFEAMRDVYYRNKELHGSSFLRPRLMSVFFSKWRTYIHELYKASWYDADKVKPFVGELDALFDEMEWFVSNVKKNYTLVDPMRFISSSFSSEMHAVMSIEKQDSYEHRLHDMVLQVYSEDFSEYATKHFREVAGQIVERYIKMHTPTYSDRITPYATTPLMEFLGIPGYEETHARTEEDLHARAEERHRQYEEHMEQAAVAEVSEMDVADLTDDDDEWAELLNRLDFGDNDGDDDDEEEKESEPLDLSDENVHRLYAAIDSLLAGHDLSDRYSGHYYEVIQTYRELTFNLAQIRMLRNERDEAIRLLGNAEIIFIRGIVEMADNYALSDDAVMQVDDLSQFYEDMGETAKAKELLENAVNRIWHSYLHHIDGDGQRILLNHLERFYDDHHMTAELIGLMEKRFEIASVYHRERSFDPCDLLYRDLGYLRPIYSGLFNAYRKAGRVEEAVRLLGLWADICDATYVDCKDAGSGYEDFDRIYDRLARLYDGSPRLYKAIQQHAPRFLQDRAILVSQDDRWGYLDAATGRETVACLYQWGWRAFGDLLSVNNSRGWRYLTYAGEPVDEAGHLAAYPPVKGYGWTLDCDCNGKENYTLLTPDGPAAVSMKLDNMHGFQNNHFKVSVETDGPTSLNMLSADGRTLLFDGHPTTLYASTHGVTIAGFGCDGLWEMKNAERETLVPKGRYTSIAPFGKNTVTAVMNDSGAGFIDLLGREVVAPRYSLCRPYASGRAAVAKECGAFKNHWGFIDEAGNVVVEPQYASVGDFSEGLAWVCISKSGNGLGFRGNKYGFITPDGRMAIAAVYDDASSFLNGRALVFIGERACYIDRNGNIL